jgi:membrane protein DedA with SNARE-associated domain
MLEQILSYINTLDPGWIFVILFFFSFIENVFPPSPSDVVVIIGATLIASTSIGFIPVLFVTSIGSSLGFILMYYMGKLFGEKILRTGRLKFINEHTLFKVDMWFGKHGYKLILANRFMPGTRSVISFFSGMHELHLGKTFIYSTISAFLWNAVIIFAGMKLGQNVELIDFYLSAYSNIILSLTLLVIVFFLFRYLYFKKKK